MADTFFFLYNNDRTKRKGVDDYGIIGSQTSEKNIYKPVWNKPGGGVEGCDLFDGRRRVYGSDGRIRIRKDDTSEPAGVV